MKKIIFAILVSMSFIFSGQMFSTEEAVIDTSNSYPKGINHIDPKNVSYMTRAYAGEITVPIKVEKNKTYTLAVGEGVLTNHITYLDMEECVLYEENNHETINFHLNNHEINGLELGYYTFKTNDSLISFKRIPMYEPHSGEIMLYQGDITAFEKFEDYLGPRYPKDNLDWVVFTTPDKKIAIDSLKAEVFLKNMTNYNVVLFTDEYSVNYNVVGKYNVRFLIKSSLNTLVYNIEMRVTDVYNPVITGPDIIHFNSTEEVTNEKILSHYNYHDEVSDINTLKKEVVYNRYEGNRGKSGSYEAKIKVYDEANNYSEKIIVLRVGYAFSEVLEGPGIIYLYQDDTPITNDEIIDRFYPVDEVDRSKLDISILYNNYKGKQTPGSYSMTIEAVHNETENYSKTYYYVFNIVVLNQNAPTVLATNLFIRIDFSDRMTIEEIKEYIIKETIKINPKAKNFRITQDEYESADKEGTYYIYFQYEVESKIVKDMITIDLFKEETDSFNPLIIIIPSVLSVIAASAVIIILIRRKAIDRDMKK